MKKEKGRRKKGEGKRKKEKGRSSCNFDVCHFCNRMLARLASIQKKQQRGDAIKPSETGQYRRIE